MLNYNLKLFGYNKLFDHFVNLDIRNNLPSKILLSGQEGIGKSIFSLHLINYLFSKSEKTKYNIQENTINSESPSHYLVRSLSHPNFYLIQKDKDKKNIEIEKIRHMLNFLNKSSFDANKKIILIDGAENLNMNSSNALLKSLEESNDQNLFILTHNTNRKILDTIKSRCLIFKLNLNHSFIHNIVNQHFNKNLYVVLNGEFKNIIVSPKFLINHIIFAQTNNLDLESLDIKGTIDFIIDNKAYKKNEFISNNFQTYIEIYFSQMYLKTKDYKYYDNFLKIVYENNLINKFNLDLETFFIKLHNRYFNTKI